MTGGLCFREAELKELWISDARKAYGHEVKFFIPNGDTFSSLLPLSPLNAGSCIYTLINEIKA